MSVSRAAVARARKLVLPEVCVHSTVFGASPSSCSQCHGVTPTKIVRTDDGVLFIDGKRIGLLATLARDREEADVKRPITTSHRRRPAF